MKAAVSLWSADLLEVGAALDRLEFPPTDPDVRARLASELAAEGSAAFRERLRAVDPAG